MNKEFPRSSQYDDEIDLKELLRNGINALERGTRIILITVVVGAILGLGYFLNTKESFESNMVLSSDILVIANIQSLFAPLELLLEEDNTAQIAQKLQIEEEAAAAIKTLEVQSVFEKESDNKEGVSYFEVTATVTDNEVLPKIQEGIVSYLKSNPYVKKREAVKIEKLSALIKKAEKEIQSLDSVKNKIERGAMLSSAESRVILMENIYLQALEMAEMKEMYIEELALGESIQIVKEFTPFSKPSSPSWIICLVVGLAGGLIVGFAIIFLKELGRYVKS